MLPDRVSNPGPLTYESGALPIALRGPADLALYMVSCAKGLVGWLVGCFGLYGPFKQYFRLYRATSQREGEREEKR